MKLLRTLCVTTASLCLSAPAPAGELPEAIAAAGESHVVTVHAAGAQIYECKADASGKLAWAFREPIASLMMDGKTVGRHYAGPNWEWQDGSIVIAKVAGRAPGATAADIPLLKLSVTARRGAGMLDGVTTVQRLATRGGVAEGACSTAGRLLSVPYAADYAFHRRARAASND